MYRAMTLYCLSFSYLPKTYPLDMFHYDPTITSWCGNFHGNEYIIAITALN